MNNFVAIDFETANHEKTSVCSIGVVIVRDGQIDEQFYELIKPYPNYYASWATQCHGLSSADTNNSPDFPKVWNKIAPKIKGLPLVAHNKNFDESRLLACLAHYNLDNPQYPFYCTLLASRKTFPSLSNHQLHTVSAHIGFELTDHHHALADAQACAMIAMKIL